MPLLFFQRGAADSNSSVSPDLKYEELHDLYNSKYALSDEGYYLDGNFFIIISTTKLPMPHKNLSVRRAKASAMLESTRFLKNYILDSYNPKFKELPQNSLLAVFPEFKFLIQKNLPHLLEVPLYIKIKGIQLENKFTSDQLRYAYGYREKT